MSKEGKENKEGKEKDKESGGNASTNRQPGSRFHSPPVELPSSNAQNFFEEAKITQVEENELKRKFRKFCTTVGARGSADEETFLILDDFCRMLQYYECASAQHYEAYFHAIDRNNDDKLDFQEFFLGCCAADPSTVHILNSFTGYERSQYIFDFYDTNRSQSLEFDEFARLTADCLSLPNTNPNDEQVKRQAIEKARDLGAVEESGGSTLHFMCIKFKKFYEFIQNERLRGTSRLFRFSKSIIKPRGSHHSRRAQGSSGSTGNQAPSNSNASGGGISTAPPTAQAPSQSGSTDVRSGNTPTSSHAQGHAVDDDEDPPSGREDCEWHAHLLELDNVFDPDGEESDSYLVEGFAGVDLDRNTLLPPPYTQLPPPAPAPTLRLESDPPSVAADARTIAKKVLRCLSSPSFDGLLGGSAGPLTSDTPFSLLTPAQLRLLCNAAVRLLEPEDMVLTGLQAPVKVFGALHGQLLDLLSHFKWQQPPVEEERGDILYTTYVFLGDYADRGGFGLEVLTLLLSLKVANPHRVALLRGHHENRHINYHLGLKAECERRLGPLEGMKVFEHLNRVFEHMSLAAVINGQILALGPGVLPISLTRLDQLRRYKKPLVLPHVSQPRAAQPLDRLNEQVLLELFTPSALMPREFGAVREATPDQVKHFCSQHKLATIIRGRQVPAKGFSFDCGGRFITVSSCVNYCDLPRGNDAAMLCITKEEKATHLAVRPKVLTAQVAKIHRVLGKGVDPCDGSLVLMPARWLPQTRDSTPGRLSRNPLLDESSSEAQTISEAAALVIHLDRTIAADIDVSLDIFPAFGPGRPPGGVVRREPRGSSKGGDSPSFRARAAGSGECDNQEDWALLTASASGRSSLPDRRSLGSRRGSAPKGQETKPRAGTTSGKAFADPIVTQVVRQGDDMEAGITPKGTSPKNRTGFQPTGPPSQAGNGGIGRTESSGSSPTSIGTTKQGSTTEASTQRRSGPSPSDSTRLSISSTGGQSQVAGNSPTAGSGSNTSRESKTLPQGSNPSGGRNTPQSGGVGAASQERRNNGAKPKETSPALRGSNSRPPGTAPSPKATTPSSKGSIVGGRRASGDTASRADGADGESGGLTDPQALSRLLQEHSRTLTTSSLPASSSSAQVPRNSEQPLVLHLCRLWIEAGLGDKEWAQAFHMFETELNDQLHQTKGGGNGTEPREGRWTLETFSMWLLKRGRRLRECSQWFRAFDFDHDEMIGIGDFIQGLVAASSPRIAAPGSSCGLCSALALFRLLDLEKRQGQSLDVSDLETILGDAQVSIGADLPLSPQQIAQRATDFDFFRNSLLPRLQGASAFRLRVFGSSSSE